MHVVKQRLIPDLTPKKYEKYYNIQWHEYRFIVKTFQGLICLTSVITLWLYRPGRERLDGKIRREGAV